MEATNMDDLPKPVVEKVKYLILDTVGVGIAGSETEPGQVLIQSIKELGGASESTLFGDGSKASCVQASYVNAFLADILDYEDTLPGLSHPSAVIIPSALAMAEKVKASGEDLIVSVTVGYEVSARIGRAVRPTRERASRTAVAYAWHGLGAAAAASKLQGLDRDHILDSLAYAASATPLPTWITGYGKPFHWIKNNFGGQAAAGMMGAVLARRGYICPRSILESERGFWLMVGSDRFDPEQMTRDLGREYVILETGFKPYAACRWIHTVLDALQSITLAHNIHADDVEEVVVHCSPETVALGFDDRKPQTIVDAEFSVPYAVAMVLLREKTGLYWYQKERLRDPKILSVAGKVRLVGDLESFWMNQTHEIPAEVEVILRNGARYRRKEYVPRGDPENPVSTEFLESKFLESLRQAGMSPRRSQELLSRLKKLEEASDVSDLGPLLGIQ